MAGNISIRKKQGDVRDGNPLPVYSLDYAEEYSRQGARFFHSELVTIAGSGNRQYLLVTPNTTERVHLRLNASALAGIQVKIEENPIVSNPGTGLTPRNYDLDSVLVPSVQLSHTPSGISSGTTIVEVGSDGAVDLDKVMPSRMLLKTNSVYVITVTDVSGSANPTSTLFDWIEVTPETTSMDA